VQVRHEEGVANHLGPESCAHICEDVSEASIGERTGQPLSRETSEPSGVDAFQIAEDNTYGRANASARTTRRGRRPWHVRTLREREPGDLASGQWPMAVGPHRKGEEPSPMMHGHEKSDPAVVAKKPTNNAGQLVAELVERRAGTEGNADQQSTRRAQDRGSVSQALDRIRQVASELAPNWTGQVAQR